MANAILTLPALEVGHLATASVVSGTEDPDFPARLLADGLLNPVDQGMPAKLLGTGGGAWLLTHPAATRIDLVSFWHPGAEDLTLTFKRGSTSACSDMTATITALPKRGNGHSVPVALLLADVEGYNGDTGYAYSRVEFPAYSKAAGLKILCYSFVTPLATGIQPGFRDLTLEPSIKHVTEGGQVWPYRMPGARKAKTMTLKPTTSDLAAVAYWFEAVGDTDVTVFVLDADSPEAMICRLTGSESAASEAHALADAKLDATIAPIGPKLHQLQFSVVELSSGLPEWE